MHQTGRMSSHRPARPHTLADLPTPAVVIDQRRVLRNIQTMQAAANAHGLRLRPHAKTHKSPLIGRWQLEAGAVGLACAKLGEAEVFADAGFTDIRLPYPVCTRSNARARVCALVDRGVRVSFVDRSPGGRTRLVRRP